MCLKSRAANRNPRMPAAPWWSCSVLVTYATWSSMETKTPERQGEIRHVQAQSAVWEQDNPPLPHSPLTSDTNLHSHTEQGCSREQHTEHKGNGPVCTPTGGMGGRKTTPSLPSLTPHAVVVCGETKMVGSWFCPKLASSTSHYAGVRWTLLFWWAYKSYVDVTPSLLQKTGNLIVWI